MKSKKDDSITGFLQNEMFEVVDLKMLNKRSELLSRDGRKYIVHRSRLNDILVSLTPHFALLEHFGRRSFRYESVYFDVDYLTYRIHHQGKRRRFKIRTRLYCDAKKCFFEMKMKGGYRGNTNKRRIPYEPGSRFTINHAAQQFIADFYDEVYGSSFELKLAPVLTVSNDRITLVAKNGGERLTIDMNLSFEHHKDKYVTPSDCVIIETKTSNGRGLCDTLLKSHGLRPQRHCSKYCIGVAGMGLVPKMNTFRQTMRTIERIGAMTYIPHREGFA